MNLLDDVNKLARASIDFKDLPEGCTIDGVKCLSTMAGAALLPSLGAAAE